MTDTIEEIRARHEAGWGGWMHGYYDIDDGEQAHADRAALLRALDAMVKENAELTAVFVAQWGADMRAKQRWQIATGKEGTWPDRANLVVWLLERVEKLEAALDEAQAKVKRYENLIRAMIENEPDDAVSDGGHTVLDLWRHDARAALNQEPTHE